MSSDKEIVQEFITQDRRIAELKAELATERELLAKLERLVWSALVGNGIAILALTDDNARERQIALCDLGDYDPEGDLSCAPTLKDAIAAVREETHDAES